MERTAGRLLPRHSPSWRRSCERRLRGELPAGWDADIPVFPADAKGMATRVASGKVHERDRAETARADRRLGRPRSVHPHRAERAGRFQARRWRPATDLQGSDGGGWSYAGRNLHFGVREHAMGAIVNGLAAHGGFIPYGATFLIFSDYMRPPIRLAALMGLHVVHVFTHDSIALGEDGPTHQPVEQLAALRAIPDLIVIRPGDANETAVAWRVALESARSPVAAGADPAEPAHARPQPLCAGDGLRRGAYVLSDAPEWPAGLILIASGSEVALIVAAREQLQAEGIAVRCVSMPSWELFDAQPRATATPCCRRPCVPGWRSRRACRRAGTATSATAAMCSASTASAPPRRGPS